MLKPSEGKSRLADISRFASDDKGFYKHRVKSGLMLMAVFSAMAFLAIMHFATKADNIGFDTAIALFSVVFLVYMAIVLIYQEWLQTAKFATEFENALFAGAAGTGLAFFMIVKSDFKIVYYNPGCRKYFTYNPLMEGRNSYDKLMNIISLSHINWENAFEKVNEGEYKINFVLSTNKNKAQNMVLQIDKISRPEGFYAFKFLYHDNKGRAKETIDDIPSYLVPLLDTIPLPVYSLRADEGIRYVNPSFYDLFGYSAEEIVEKNITFNDLAVDYDNDLKMTSVLDGQIMSLRTNDNRKVTVSVEQILLPDEKGKELFRCGFLKPASGKSSFASVTVGGSAKLDDDVVSQLWIEAYSDSPISMILIDSSGEILRSNNSFSKLISEVSPQQISVSNILELVDDEDKGRILNKIKDQVTESDVQNPINISLGIHSDYDKASFILYIQSVAENIAVGYVLDKTEHKNLEQRFIQSQKMQAVGQLAGGIAHDFNNLLTAMIGFCDLMLTRHGPGEQSFADIMQIKQNANRAAGLVRQLLAFSRKQTLQPEVVDITDSLAELSNLIRRLIGENIHLNVHHGSDIWPLKVDHGQLEQVIINLCVNARDAMSNGGELTIITSNITVNASNPLPQDLVLSSNFSSVPNGDYVKVEVKDTGCGMNEDIMQQIFEPFFTTKNVGEGTGLGLATVCGIVEQTGGYIFVSSLEGKGTSFSILLPRHEEDESSKLNIAIEESVNDLTGTGLVLLVEDEAAVRMFASRALSNKGYTVLEAASGEEALQLINEEKPEISIIVTDVMMPGITGPEMVKEIRQTTPDIPVVFVSGYAEDVFHDSYGDDRDFHFLPKPFTLKQLAAKIKEVMTA